MEFKDSIVIFENAFTEEECQRIIDRHEWAIENGKAHEGGFGNLKGIKKSTDYDLVSGDGKEDYLLTNIVAGKFNFFNLKYLSDFCPGDEYDPSNVIMDKTYYPLFQIQKYRKNDGHFNSFHLENYGEEAKDRLFVFILYLNDVVEGGETEFYFKEEGSEKYFAVQPKAGTLIIHPASWPYVHRGCVPKSSDKYILTTWCCYGN